MIKIVADTSSDISWEYADKNNIKLIPLNLRFYDKKFNENRDYDFDRHYQYYSEDPKFSPKTAQPAPADFLEAYKELVEEGATDIIVITISSQLSGTLNSANLAKMKLSETNPNITIHLVDSKNASYAEGFLVEKAVALKKKGKEAKKIADILRSTVSKIKSYLLVPTLKYLYYGGRISWTKYMIAKLLRKKAIIKAAEDGSLQPVEAISNVIEGAKKIITLLQEEQEKSPKKIAIVYATNYDLRDTVIELVNEQFPTSELLTLRTRAAITAHVSPSTIAVIAQFE
ncbi:MAG: DegV family protein [Asgard group archaeon]|nr:DegV family protein [Asgard group archaeon]